MKQKITIFSIFIALLTLQTAVVFAETYTINANSHASIGTVLELAISQQGQSELRFGHITPSALDSTETPAIHVLVEINSNSGERYLVTQTLNTPLQNTEGDTMPSESLKFTSSSSRSSGSPVTVPTDVSLSPQVIFTSDGQGSSDTVDASYVLTVPPSQAPGDYSASLTYTVSAI